MTNIVRFYKKNGKWYADVPNHTLEECEMVYGTDVFFNFHTNRDDTELIVEFSDKEPSFKSVAILNLVGSYGEDGGAMYEVYDDSPYPTEDEPYKLSICTVALDFFKKFPDTIYVLNVFHSVKDAIIQQGEELSLYSNRDWQLRRNIENLYRMIEFPQIDELKGKYFFYQDGDYMFCGGRFVKSEKTSNQYFLLYNGFKFFNGGEFYVQKNSCIPFDYEDIVERKAEIKSISEDEYNSLFQKYLNIKIQECKEIDSENDDLKEE